jgi:ParB/Sulfiredoxin domain
MTKIRITGVHPVAQLLPPIPNDEFAGLVASIKQIGQQLPITCDPSGLLLDGIHRSKACEMAGVKPNIVVYDGDPVAFILAANITRRHLNAGQCAMIIALARPEPEKCGRGRPSQLSNLEGYSAARLSEARKIIRHSRDLALEVVAGTTPFHQALWLAGQPAECTYSLALPKPSSRNMIVLEDVVLLTPKPQGGCEPEDTVVDFKSRYCRADAGIEAGSAGWDRLRDQVATTLVAWPGAAKISAVLRALLDTLESDGLSRRDAKALIASHLDAFED